MEKITVLLAEDHRVVRQGIRQFLEREADLEVVGVTGTDPLDPDTDHDGMPDGWRGERRRGSCAPCT